MRDEWEQLVSPALDNDRAWMTCGDQTCNAVGSEKKRESEFLHPKHDDELTLQLPLKRMVLWVESLWSWIALASEVTRLAACPVHGSPSCLPWLVTGFLLGCLFVSVAIGFFIFWWTFRPVDFRPTFRAASSTRFPARPRLDRYLDE